MSLRWNDDFDNDEDYDEEEDYQILDGIRNGDVGVPSLGYRVNDNILGDGEYAQELFRSSRAIHRDYDPSKFYFNRPAPPEPPISEILAALKAFDKKVVEGEPGDIDYIRRRFQSRVVSMQTYTYTGQSSARGSLKFRRMSLVTGLMLSTFFVKRAAVLQHGKYPGRMAPWKCSQYYV